MSFKWINPNDFSFNCLLLMDRWLIEYICTHNLCGSYEEYEKNLGIALANNQSVAWYCKAKAPRISETVDRILVSAPTNCNLQEIRKAECYILEQHDWAVTYMYPDIMNSNCPYIYNWDKQRLFELADFDDKVVLDVGAGTGRLTFAAAEKAQHVYASEPCDELRLYMREKIQKEAIQNVSVLDGVADCLPYEDNTFDIVMSGHVVGDNYQAEIAELERVTKNGGWILDCIGENSGEDKPRVELTKRGFEYLYYVSKTCGDIYRYRKQVIKN